MERTFVAVAVIASCLLPVSASAQEAGRTGVTMAFPASVGVIHHVSDTIAVRPDVSFSYTKTDATFGETSSTSTGLGLSLLVYARKWDSAAAYVSPRFAWSHGSGESRSKSGVTGTESSADAYTWSGAVGAQGWIGNRFSVFGEVGVGYTHGTADSPWPAPELKTKALGLRSGVGAVIYF